MSHFISKFAAILALAAFASVSFFGATAAAQYEPAPPVDSGQTAGEILAGIQANAAANAAAHAAANADVAGAEAAVAKITALAKAHPDNTTIQAALASAKASVATAKAASSVSVPATNNNAGNGGNTTIAYTGSDVSLPVTAGAILIGSGGLMLLAANKRSRKED